MRPAFDYDGSAVYNIDARDLPSVLDGPVDAVVTDPPYELGLGTAGETARWDSTGIAFDPDFWRAILGVMRPGAFLFAFGSPRTWHRLACAVEDAGFLIRDQLCWLYASGMPKGEWGDHAVDRALGVSDPRASREAGSASLRGRRLKEGAYIPATPEASRWTGFNPALKPAWEPVVVAQRPREAMLGRNLLDHGTGALDVADAAVPADMAELGRRYERNSRLRDGDPRGG
ncbi:site-specific DNA-methyltransferase, partial [Bifidobacterium adolescentis]